MKIIVCGGRDYANRKAVFDALDCLNLKRGVEKLSQGGASGADALAAEWAKSRGVKCKTYAADWKTHGKAAGPRRNQAMLVACLSEGPIFVVAFPGGRGTEDMVSKAKAAGVKVWRP